MTAILGSACYLGWIFFIYQRESREYEEITDEYTTTVTTEDGKEERDIRFDAIDARTTGGSVAYIRSI